MAAVLTARDGLGPETVLTALLTTELGKHPAEALWELYEGGRQKMAALAPLVFRAAGHDAVAAAILDRNMAAAARLIDISASHFPGGCTVVCAGGLCLQWEVLSPLLRAHLSHPEKITLTRLEGAPVLGALRMAGLTTLLCEEATEPC